MAGFDYYQKKSELWSHVTSCLDTLRQEYDLIIIEEQEVRLRSI